MLFALESSHQKRETEPKQLQRKPIVDKEARTAYVARPSPMYHKFHKAPKSTKEPVNASSESKTRRYGPMG